MPEFSRCVPPRWTNYLKMFPYDGLGHTALTARYRGYRDKTYKKRVYK